MSTTGSDDPDDISAYPLYYSAYKEAVYHNLFTGIVCGEGQ
jgi:hypothetical protein